MFVDIDVEPIQHKRRRIPSVLPQCRLVPAIERRRGAPGSRSSGIHLTHRIQPWDANVTIWFKDSWALSLLAMRGAVVLGLTVFLGSCGPSFSQKASSSTSKYSARTAAAATRTPGAAWHLCALRAASAA